MQGRVARIWGVLAEFRRRGVFKAVTAYAVVAWGASLAATDLLPAFGAPEWTVRAFILCAALGVPVVAVLAWVYEITARGIVRDTTSDAHGDEGHTTLFALPTGVLARWEDAVGTHEQTFLQSFAIGREGPCELRIEDPRISRRHAEVCFEQGRWWLVDCGSRNGTRLDGRLVERAPLPERGCVQLYDHGPKLWLELQSTGTTTLLQSASRAPADGPI